MFFYINCISLLCFQSVIDKLTIQIDHFESEIETALGCRKKKLDRSVSVIDRIQMKWRRLLYLKDEDIYDIFNCIRRIGGCYGFTSKPPAARNGVNAITQKPRDGLFSNLVYLHIGSDSVLT